MDVKKNTLLTQARNLFFLIPHIHSITRIRYGFVSAGLISLFLNYKYNVTAHSGMAQVNNFLDFVVSFADFYCVAVFLFFVCFRFRFVQIITLVNFVPIAVFLAQGSELTLLWQWITTFSRVSILVWIGYQLFISSPLPKAVKILYSIGLLQLGLFDYYLISDSLLPLLLVIFYLFISTPISTYNLFNRIVSWGLVVWNVINLLTSVFQIVFSRSLGLKYMGEPFLRIFEQGIAKQIIPYSSQIIMRPYGLTNHPNILAGVSLVVLFMAFVSYVSVSKSKIFTRLQLYILVASSLTTLLLSISRNGYITFFCCSVMLLLLTKESKSIASLTNYISRYSGVILSIGVMVFALVIFSSSTRISTSDVYRIDDYRRYFETVKRLHITDYLFGLGYGSYPFVLREYYQLENWAYQPVHSLPLYILLSGGLVQVVCLLVFRKRNYTLTSTLPQWLYIQLYSTHSQQRNNELMSTILSNYTSQLFQKIIIFVENEESKNTLLPLLNEVRDDGVCHIVFVQDQERLTYKKVFQYALNQDEHIVVLANTDIRFDTSLTSLRNIPITDTTLIALTRYEEDGKIMPDGREDFCGEFYSHSQDVWITHSKNSLHTCQLELGKPACDQRLLLFALGKGYLVYNPFDTIKVHHNHSSNIRSYIAGTSEYRGLRVILSSSKNTYSILYE